MKKEKVRTKEVPETKRKNKKKKGPYIVVNPWIIHQIGESDDTTLHTLQKYEGSLFAPRLLCELQIYSLLSKILDKKEIEKKWFLHQEKYLNNLRNEFPSFPLYEDYIQSAILYCIEESTLFHFWRTGLPYTFSKWLAPSKSEELILLLSSYKQHKGIHQIRVHPKSENQVYDIIHPCWHTQKKWIPSDFDPRKGKFTSYINNLHPSEKKLYHFIEWTIQESLPLLNKCLAKPKPWASPKVPTPFAERKIFGDVWINLNISHHISTYVEEAREKERQRLEQVNPSYEDENNIEDDQFVIKKLNEIQIVPKWPSGVSYQTKEKAQPKFIPRKQEVKIDAKQFYSWSKTNYLEKEESLQFYVKIASIVLTPEQPTYSFSQWHVEGMHSEHIVATAIFYFETENITDSYIEFRIPIVEPPYEQNEFEIVNYLFGLTQSARAEQTLGKIQTSQDRLIVFPNCYQHRVPSFSLLDKTKPGKRSFLLLWLVDPRVRLASTSTETIDNGPRSWISNELDCHIFFKMKVELICNLITDYVSNWKNEKEIQKQVEIMMTSRKIIYTTLSTETEKRELNLCEH